MGDGEQAQIHADEVAAATATLSCRADFEAAYRDAAIAHFPDFRELYDTALRLGLEPAAQG